MSKRRYKEIEAGLHVWQEEPEHYGAAIYLPKHEDGDEGVVIESTEHTNEDGAIVYRHQWPEELKQMAWARKIKPNEVKVFRELLGDDLETVTGGMFTVIAMMVIQELDMLNGMTKAAESIGTGSGEFPVFFKDGSFYARVLVEESEKTRRATNFIRQTQGNAKRAKKYAKLAKHTGIQLDLLRETKREAIKVDSSGIVLSAVESRIAHGLNVLLEETGQDDKGYPLGNRQLIGRNSKGEESLEGYLLYVSANELLEAAGYRRGKNGRYSKSARDRVDTALESLRVNQHKIYVDGIARDKRFSFEQGLAIVPVVERVKFDELPSGVAGKYEPRETLYKLQLHSIWTHGIDKLWLELPKDIYKQLDDTKRELGHRVGGRGANNHAVELYLWISSLTGKANQTKLKRATIAERLRLAYLVENRHTLKLDTAIQQAFSELEHMGLIKSWAQVDDMYHYEKED